jgi:predicted phage gp36 major capsid-like protein
METEGNLLQELVEALNAGEGLRGLPPARLQELASHARALRQEVEERWDELPPGLRRALGDLAWSWEEDPSAQRDTPEELEELLRELIHLSRAVTDRLEEEDPAFREALERALAEESEPWRGLDSLELDP